MLIIRAAGAANVSEGRGGTTTLFQTGWIRAHPEMQDCPQDGTIRHEVHDKAKDWDRKLEERMQNMLLEKLSGKVGGRGGCSYFQAVENCCEVVFVAYTVRKCSFSGHGLRSLFGALLPSSGHPSRSPIMAKVTEGPPGAGDQGPGDPPRVKGRVQEATVAEQEEAKFRRSEVRRLLRRTS